MATSVNESMLHESDVGATCDILHSDRIATFERDYYAQNKPVIIRGLAGRYPCRLFEWSTDYLDRIMGNKSVPVMTTRTGFLSYEREFATMPFQDFLDYMFERRPGDGVRYYYKNPTTLLPEGHEDSERIPEFSAFIRRSIARNLWISGSGLTVGLHFDPADNLNFQLRGTKRFSLYPPGIRQFYPLPMFSQTAHISGVFREGPKLDSKRFPRFDPKAAIHIELNEGDVLYLPAYWWHQVESVGKENVNFNCWWLPMITKQLANWNQALRGHVQIGLRLLRHGNIQQTPPPKS